MVRVLRNMRRRRSLPVAIAAAWLSYMVVYCTTCPEAATSLVRCAVASAGAVEGYGLSAAVEDSHHARQAKSDEYSHEHHRHGGKSESFSQGHSPDGGAQRGNDHGHHAGDDCCESGQSRLAKASGFHLDGLWPVVAISIGPLVTHLSLPVSTYWDQKLAPQSHSPPLYLLLQTFLN